MDGAGARSLQPGDGGSVPEVAAVVIGSQVPRLRLVPAYVSSHGQASLELALGCGLILDKWQRDTLVDAMGCRDDGKFAAWEVGVNATRQNGKGGILEARELGSIFELGDKLVIHSAHEFATAMTAMDRMEELLEEGGLIGELRKKPSRSHGEEGFKFKGGRRIWYRTRTKGGGRGFSADLVILDEAMVLQEAFHGALIPIMSARSMTGNPQVWYTGSAVDRLYHEHGIVFSRVRERAMSGEAPSLAYFEFSAGVLDEDGNEVPLDLVDEALLARVEYWAQANPAMGIRISPEHIEHERRSMARRTFATERLGIGEYASTAETAQSVIDMDDWNALEDVASITVGQVSFAFDVTPDRAASSIAVSGRRGDGLSHVEVTDRNRGTAWLVPRLAELNTRHSPGAVFCSGSGITGSLVPELEQAGVPVVPLNATEYAQACASLVDAVEEKRLRHLGQKELRDAVKGATTRDLGDAWAWSRKSSSVDISPLVAGTLALWGTSTAPSGEFVVDVQALMAS